MMDEEYADCCGTLKGVCAAKVPEACLAPYCTHAYQEHEDRVEKAQRADKLRRKRDG